MKFKALASALLAAAFISCAAAQPSPLSGVCITAEAAENKITYKLNYTDKYTYLTLYPSSESNTLRYTTNGTAPTLKSKKYTTLIRFKQEKTVRVAEFDSIGKKVCGIKFTIKRRCSEPEVEILSTDGKKAEVSVSTATADAAIYYTTDGSKPDKNSNLYEGSFTVETGAVVKAVAFKKNWKTSEITSLTITESAPRARKYDEFVTAILTETNKAREANGLKPLEISEILCSAAEKRANEIGADYSIQHTRPNGDKYSTVLNEVDYFYSIAGENIGKTTSKTEPAERIVKLWLNSAVHRANILGDKFAEIGIGWEEINGTYYFVQLFGTELE